MPGNFSHTIPACATHQKWRMRGIVFRVFLLTLIPERRVEPIFFTDCRNVKKFIPLFLCVVLCFWACLAFSQCLNLYTTGTPCINNTLTANLDGVPALLEWSLNGTVVKSEYPSWNSTGTTITSNSAGPNPPLYPSGIFVDNAGNLYVADEQNQAIQKFAPGSVAGVTVAGGHGSGSAANQFNAPTGIWVTSNGDMYITDQLNHRVQKWIAGASSGTTVAGTGVAGSALTQLNQPTVMYMDAYGYM